MTPTTDQLLLLADDQIDYENLPVEVLYELASQRNEPFIATSALAQLAARFPSEFVFAAETILRSPWEKYLTSYALQTLFSIRPHETKQFVQHFATSHDPVILEAVVESVVSDPVEFSAEFRRSLAARIMAVKDHAFMSPEVIDAFLKSEI